MSPAILSRLAVHTVLESPTHARRGEDRSHAHTTAICTGVDARMEQQSGTRESGADESHDGGDDDDDEDDDGGDDILRDCRTSGGVRGGGGFGDVVTHPGFCRRKSPSDRVSLPVFIGERIAWPDGAAYRAQGEK
ncbi:unnamed protein product [Pleuronectes platessa]|uniref:Uncharacterized protein n=1 Tax=Pleuronectes platessa TaxID=8262 RepID=A0A9N7TH00_PLEPL|nr:unnamed protein product [Pleuronectes platessa]